MERQKQLDYIRSILDQNEIDKGEIKKAVEQLVENFYQKTGEEKVSKEVMRGLRIQNKKLLEQVTILKEEIKKTKLNKTRVLNQINELLKLINS